MKPTKPAMGYCLKCRQVRVLVGGLCRDCRASASAGASVKPPEK